MLNSCSERGPHACRIACATSGKDDGRRRCSSTGYRSNAGAGSRACRRIVNRIVSSGAKNSADYLSLLERTPDEAWHLLERLTIKVSRFFRDRAVFDFLSAEVFPGWAHRRRPVRIWSAGCARGEEAYTLAALLVHHDIPGAVLATDVDPEALRLAEVGCYPQSSLDEMDAGEIALCFGDDDLPVGTRRVAEAVRRRVSFARHDLTLGPPPVAGGFDLICCRNVLIYFAPAMQRSVQAQLVQSLDPGGYLCLGEAEWPDTSLMNALQAMPRRLRTFRRHAGCE
jgi:chemotaxis protein methyltransferase CheR